MPAHSQQLTPFSCLALMVALRDPMKFLNLRRHIIACLLMGNRQVDAAKVLATNSPLCYYFDR